MTSYDNSQCHVSEMRMWHVFKTWPSPTTTRTEMSNLHSLLEQYLQGPQQLRQAVAGLSREQLIARPVAGKWSTLEVVAHLADFDPILADRIKRVIAEDK